ncbi:lysosome-associated membrane glycoprotein 1-like [Montipora foliosa]|uniref:lysosome-associated membrane glycoprotein 1-like n=1 Tax=Montipora foliosa TaxID=591990 RepID=UPI0035F182BD
MSGAQAKSLLRLSVFVFLGLKIVTADKGHLSAAPTMGPGNCHFNVSCVLLDISCSVSVDLHVGSTVQTVRYNLPQSALPSGNCASEVSYITLEWNNTRANLSLSLTFEKEKNEWETSSLNFTAKGFNNQALITNSTEKEVIASETDSSKLKIGANSNRSFKCDQEMVIPLQGKVKVVVSMRKIWLQPFTGKHGVFGGADICTSTIPVDAKPVDTIVPIAVGCVLAGLIIILIITYFVGRCKRPGYQKM